MIFFFKLILTPNINKNLLDQLRCTAMAKIRNNESIDSWTEIPLGDAIELIIDHRGVTPKKLKSEWSEEGVIALSAKNIKNDSLVNLNACNKVDDTLYEKWMSEKLKAQDILMTSEAPLGEFYYLANYCKYCLSQRLFAIRANKTVIEPTVLYFQLTDWIGKGLIAGRMSGTTVTGIRQSELVKIPVIIPDKKTQLEFSTIADPMMEKIESNNKETERLTELRDYILPKLMNGEIDVSDLKI